MPGKCVFNARWLQCEQYCSWLMRTSDVHKARCKICLKDFNIGGMGEPALRSHAEKTHQLTWIAKSNSLRRSAKEKTEELKAVDEQLDEKLLQLKNC